MSDDLEERVNALTELVNDLRREIREMRERLDAADQRHKMDTGRHPEMERHTGTGSWRGSE